MKTILEWFNKLTNFLGYWLPKLGGWIKDIGLAFWGLLVAVVGLLWAIVTHLVPMVTLVLNMIAGLTTGEWHFTFPDALANVFKLGNTLLPLEEFFQYLVAYGTLITALAIYRFVKNLIPTEAGS